MKSNTKTYKGVKISEVARIFRFRCGGNHQKKPETVRGWIRNGKLKARKPPFCRDYIIRKDDFERFWYGEPQTSKVSS